MNASQESKHNGHGRMYAEYAGESKDELPVGGYAALIAAFTGIFGTLLAVGAARRALPRGLRTRDVILLGIATHKLTRIVTRDWVTIPLRFAFTHYEGSDGAGEVKESARGSGIRRALGDLVSCQFCSAPWIASAITAGFIARPRETRVVAGVLAMVTLSDFLHHVYARAKRLST